MAIEVVPISVAQYTGLNEVQSNATQSASVTINTTLQNNDLLLLFHTTETGSSNLPAPSAGSTHNSANFEPGISYNGTNFVNGTTAGFVDLGYARGEMSNGDFHICAGAYALTLDSANTLSNLEVRMRYTNLGTAGERTSKVTCFVVRNADVSDFSSSSSTGVLVSRSSASGSPDDDGDLEWIAPTNSLFSSSTYSGTITQFALGTTRRNNAIRQSNGTNLSVEDTTNNTLLTSNASTTWDLDTGGFGTTEGGTQARSGGLTSTHNKIVYFNRNRTFANLSYPYAFRMAHSNSGHSDTNSGATLSIFLREAATSTPGTPASLTADYAISVTGSPSTLGSEYAVTSTGTEADLQSSYTVKLTGDPQTLSSSYAVTDPDQTSTLGSEYAVKDTSGTANLSGLYAVQSTGTPATLSSEYQVAVPDSEDLSSDYAVKVQGDAQSLTSSYAVKVQGSPPSLSSSYDIASAEPGTPATLGSEYSVKSTGNPQEVEADYSVTSTATVANLGGSYGVTSTGDPQTLSSGYAVTAPPNGVSLGAEYTVSVTGDEQEVSSAYAVTSSDDQTLTGSYVISDPDAISLSASYAVQSQGQDQDLTGTYGVTSASEDLPSLSSAYAVTSTGTAQTLDGSYLVSVAGQEADLLSDYAVTSSGTEPELTAGYAITSIVDIDNSYAIKTSDTLEVSSSYAVTVSDTENLSASYALIESKTQEIQASYEITGFTASAPVTELYAEYAVINQDHLGYKAFRQLSILRQRVK